jgi:hypothetical protein
MIISIQGLKNKLDVNKTSDLGLARKWAQDRKAGMIVLGNDSKYWVVKMSDAARLEKLGFEVISNY